MTPRWQKARIVNGEMEGLQKVQAFYETMLGREIWLQVEKPRERDVLYENRRIGKRLSYVSNVYGPTSGRIIGLEPEIVEFLARGPEDFAEHVDTITFAQWQAETAPAVS